MATNKQHLIEILLTSSCWSQYPAVGLDFIAGDIQNIYMYIVLNAVLTLTGSAPVQYEC